MKLEEAREQLIPYLRGELNPDRKAEMDEKLKQWEALRKELESVRHVLSLTQLADDDSIADLGKSLMVEAIHRGASDLHLEKVRDAPRVRFRVDGLLQLGPEVEVEQLEPLITRFKMLSGMNVAERQLPQDGRILFTHDAKEYDFRVSVFPYFNGEGVVMRILDRSSVLIGMEKLGFLPEMRARLEALISQPNGVILAAGPTGCGKTTTLYSLLERLNRPEIKILSIEDPVEYSLAGLNQATVNRNAGLTFATALRGFLRQDPDVLFVGEIRDLETLQLVSQAALTGHLVLSALHTKDSVSALIRMIDIGLESYLVAASVLCVLSQRLVRKVCENCKTTYAPSESELAALGFKGELRPSVFYRGSGCEQCRHTGYRGRTGLFELLTVDKGFEELIGSGASESTLREDALKRNLLWPFPDDARIKITEGITTVEEALRVLP